MWKKVFIVLLSLVGTFSVVYAVNSDMFAAGTTYNAGGNINGRFNRTAGNLGVLPAENLLQKGDKILSGTNGVDSGNPLSWILVMHSSNYTDYTQPYSLNTVVIAPGEPNDPPQSAWQALANDTIAKTIAADKSIFDISMPNGSTAYKVADYGRSKLIGPIQALNSRLKSGNGQLIIANRDLTPLRRRANYPGDYSCNSYVYGNVMQFESERGKVAFINPHIDVVAAQGYDFISLNDLKFFINYWDIYNNELATSSRTAGWQYVDSQGGGVSMVTSDTANYGIRPSAFIDTEKIVFATSEGTSTDIGSITRFILPATYDSLYDTTLPIGNLKARVYDSTMQVNLDGIVDDSNHAITKVLESETIQLRADANSGNSKGVHTVSAVVFDEQNNFLYYKPLAPAVDGMNNYAFDLTGIDAGTYKIGIVNEAYDENSTEPLISSDISTVFPLEIVEPHTIAYTAAPQTQTTYEYDKNVEAGNKIGAVSRSDGVVPIHYEIVADGDNTYQNFEIDGLDVNGDSSAASLDIKVKATGAPDVVSTTNSLKVGTYKFCIESIDAKGRPTSQVVGQSKVCASLSVDKTLPTISFATTTQKDMKIGEAIFSDTVTTTNKDTLKSDDITYALTGGIAGVLTATHDTSNPLVYKISIVNTHVGTNLPKTFTLGASIKATDNYLAATTSTNRTIYAYKDLSELTWVANQTTYSSSQVVANSTVGTLLGKDGVGPFKYEMTTSTDTGYVAAEATDNASFAIVNGASVASGSVNVKTAMDLAVGTYHIQFKVTDAKGKVIYAKAEIEVSAQTQSAVDFKSGTGGSIITNSGLTIKYKDTNKALFAEGGSTSLPIEYYVATQADQPNQIDPSLYLVVNKISGQLEPKKVGKVKVYAQRPGGTSYATAKSRLMEVTITEAEQSIAFDGSSINQAFSAGGTFMEPATLTETGTNTVSTRAITYTSTTPSVCSIDASGTVTMNTVGNCTITAENKDANWKATTATKTINLYSGMGVSFAQSDTPQAGEANAQAGSPVGSLTISGGQGNKTYAVSTNNDPKNKDASFFSVNSSGIISLANAVSASDIATYYDATKQAYIMHVQFETTDALSNTVTTDAEVEFKGAILNAAFDTAGTGKITKVYSPNGTFTLNPSSNAGNGTIKYQLKNDPTMPSDVLQSVSAAGLVTIKNANDKAANPNPVYVEAIIEPSGGYDGETIETEVVITKAPQPSFGFQNTTINMSLVMEMSPSISGKLSTGTVSLSSANTSLITVNGSNIVSSTSEGTTTITAIDAGDRNYKTATNTATVNISGAPAYGFIINVPSATYGDTGLSASIILDELEDLHPGAVGTQVWESSDPAIAEINNNKEITIHKAGTITITCTQTSLGIPTVSSSATLVINPKPIEITIHDKSKYVGEVVPVFDMTTPTGALVGSDTITLPTFSCVDGTSTPVTNITPVGSYPIKGTYATGENPNYKIKVTPGTLTVKQDASLASWYHLEGVTSGNTLDPTKWYNEDVKVVLDTATESAGTYDEISLDQALWNSTSIMVTTEDENSEDVSFRINASGILSTSQPSTIKIDKTKPVIKSITGTQINKSGLNQLMNKLTFGAFFKPGTKVSIQSEDILPTPTTKVSGVKEIIYNVYEIEKTTSEVSTTPVVTGTLNPNATGKAEITLNDVGLYRVCALAKDNAGNESIENCSDINIKKIDIDVDGDGTLDFNDPDEDGCPDLNIVLGKDSEENWIKLNEDLNGDQLPELNIDSNGGSAGSLPDGKAVINIDTDDDKKPDLNIVDIKTWNPKICVTGQVEEYCTDDTPIPNRNIDFNDDGRPDINIDLNGDGIPDIDIDTDGDGKKDINIDTNQDGTPDEKIKVMKEWVLDEKVFEYSKIKFHTMTGLKEDKIDHLEDGGVVAKPGDGQTFLPNYALKVTDKTTELDEETKSNIEKIVPDKAFKKYLKIDLTKDNAVIQPDGKVSISIPIDQAIKNPKVMIEQADGTFVEAIGTLEDGVFTYETLFVGGVVVFGDEVKEDVKEPDPITPDLPTLNKPDTSVKGTYTGGIGGAGTGDSTNNAVLITGGILALTILFFLTYKRRKEE